MACLRVSFPRIEWSGGAHPLERKKVADDAPVSLLSFAPGFIDPNWCTRAHAGLILKGRFALELEVGTEIFEQGDAFVVDAGTRHRAANPGEDDVLLFIHSGP